LRRKKPSSREKIAVNPYLPLSSFLLPLVSPNERKRGGKRKEKRMIEERKNSRIAYINTSSHNSSPQRREEVLSATGKEKTETTPAPPEVE